ncbi:MAG: VOC family protein, partial [Dehalococcoidia bacterium]
MISKLAHVTIIVRDLDEALKWYTEVLGLEVRADDSGVIPGFRWLTVAPKGQKDVEIVLFKPGVFQDEEATRTLLERVGQGTMWMFQTDDCRKEYETLSAKGVKFFGPPQEVPWG